jgi:hypothetical protein
VLVAAVVAMSQGWQYGPSRDRGSRVTSETATCLTHALRQLFRTTSPSPQLSAADWDDYPPAAMALLKRRSEVMRHSWSSGISADPRRSAQRLRPIAARILPLVRQSGRHLEAIWVCLLWDDAKPVVAYRSGSVLGQRLNGTAGVRIQGDHGR